MATVVNNPGTTDTGGSNSFLVGVILLIVFIFALLYFGVPMLNRATPQQPAPAAPTTEIDVPEQVDVNVTNGEGQ